MDNLKPPSQGDIDQVKSTHPLRSVHLVEVEDNGETHHFLVTGPVTEELNKFLKEIEEAKNDQEKLRKAGENASLAQIRWPDRAEVKQLFSLKPLLSTHIAAKLTDFAGSSAEVRSKKL